jgi:hypothetical protein
MKGPLGEMIKLGNLGSKNKELQTRHVQMKKKNV